MPDSLTTETLTTDFLTTENTTTENTTTDNIDLINTETNTDNSDPQATESTDSLYPADANNPPSEADNLIFEDPTSQDSNLDDSQDNVPVPTENSGNVIDSEAENLVLDDSNSQDNSQDDVPVPTENSGNVIDSEAENPVLNDSNSQDNSQDNVPASTENGGNVIDVDNDFGGDLQSAIAAANSGDVVRLGNSTYAASGITIDKDITLDGQEGSVIDGGGSADSILNVTQDASGATIQNIELTNSNNGIYGFGASNVTLANLDINNIGVSQTITDGENNTGIIFNSADGLRITNTDLSNIGRKGIGIGDTVGAVVSDVTVENVNLDAQHAVNHDAAGIKFYNTTDSVIQNSYFSNNYANSIWADTTTGTEITNNNVEGVAVGDISGIYYEKSPNSSASNNSVTGVDGSVGFDATALTTETLDLGENDFSSQLLSTEDYFVNPAAETLIALTEDPLEANFELIREDYSPGADIS